MGKHIHDITRLLVHNRFDVTVKVMNNWLNALGGVCCFYTWKDLIDIIRMMMKNSSIIASAQAKNLEEILLRWYAKRTQVVMGTIIS